MIECYNKLSIFINDYKKISKFIMKTRSQTAPPNKTSSYSNGPLKEDIKKDQS